MYQIIFYTFSQTFPFFSFPLSFFLYKFFFDFPLKEREKEDENYYYYNHFSSNNEEEEEKYMKKERGKKINFIDVS